MKIVNIKLDDSVYEQLMKILHESGQTTQMFYETYTKKVLNTYHKNDSKKSITRLKLFIDLKS